MAKYGGNYNCGCGGVVEVVGPEKDREWKVDKHFDRLCDKCINEKLINKANEMGLPNLEGTQKQVDWALQIRNEFINNIDARFVKIEQNSGKLDVSRGITVEGLKGTLVYLYETMNSACFWIDNRDDLNDENNIWLLIAKHYNNANINLNKK